MAGAALRTPAGRAPGVMDWVIGAAGALAATAATGAVLVLGADTAERLMAAEAGGPGLLVLAWILGAAMMAAPLPALPFLPFGLGVYWLARRASLGGWLPAMLAGALVPALRAGGRAPLPDAILWLSIGAAGGLAFWLILRTRCRG